MKKEIIQYSNCCSGAMKAKLFLFAGFLIFTFFSCITPPFIPSPGKGSISNPVRCDMPEGQRSYLQRLTDEKGRRVYFRYIDSVLGPEGHILDIFEIYLSARRKAEDARKETSVIEMWKKELYRGNFRIYMDMYNPNVTDDEPVFGLRFLEAESGTEQKNKTLK